MHCVEEVLTLRVDSDSELFAFPPQSILEFGSAFARSRSVGDYYHRELPLDDCLVDVRNAAIRLRQNLRYPGHDPRMVQAKN